ncbi:MAG: ATP-dependent zinc protease [Burkholderiales bacterium]|nr:ATP-dependent zinc protease [Burkholderiales bacterium]MDR4518808.1 RimK/LysX family protein [Nitrosomonas sp.]
MKKATSTQIPIIGWREWLALPDLRIPRIKAKVDTGARTSALHAFWIDAYKKNNQPWIRFAIHPIQNSIETVIECDALVKDRRIVTDSGGHKQRRYVIETPVCLGAYVYAVELTLTQRDTMKFRMLLGRTAINNRFLVDPAASFLLGRL